MGVSQKGPPHPKIAAPQNLRSAGLQAKNRANRAFKANGAASKPDRKLRRFINQSRRKGRLHQSRCKPLLTASFQCFITWFRRIRASICSHDNSDAVPRRVSKSVGAKRLGTTIERTAVRAIQTGSYAVSLWRRTILSFFLTWPAFVNRLENEIGVRDGVRNGALPRRAGRASDLVQFSCCQDRCGKKVCIFPLLND